MTIIKFDDGLLLSAILLPKVQLLLPKKNKMEQSNKTSNLSVRVIEGAYGLRIDQPEVTLIKIGDTSMIAEAFDVHATTLEELVEKVAESFHMDKSCLTILNIAEVEKIHKTAAEHPKRLRIF